MSINSIEIAGVRGIRQAVLLQLSGRSLLVHGENGTGKTSIVQALAWALRGDTPPTQDDAYSSEESFRTHVLESREAPRVTVYLTDGGTIEVDSEGARTSGSGQSFRASALAASPILTRNKLLAVVSDKPADRFRYLESFLDLESADSIRDSILSRGMELQKLARQKTDRTKHLLQSVRLDSPTPVDSFEVLASALGLQAAQLGLSLALPSWTQVLEAGHRAGASASPSEVDGLRVSLLKGASIVDELNGESTIELPDLDALKETRARLAAIETDAELSDVLVLARKHLAHRPVSRCPLCDQPVDHEILAASIDSRLKHLAELRAVSESLRAAGRRWQTWWAKFVVALDSVLPTLGARRLGDVPGVPEAPTGARLLHEKKDASGDEFLEALLAVGFRRVHQWATLAVSSLRAALSTKLAALPTPANSAKFESFSASVARGAEVRDEVLTLEREADATTKLATSLLRLGEALRLARQDVAQQLLSTISQTVADYYSRVHPQEDDAEVTDAPVLEVQRHRDGTAFVRGQFNGHRIADPRWAYSDGHQDTVGLCIFLALRKFRARLPNDCRLMVLDDVVLSIDLPHTGRVARLIRDEFSDHQVLFLTHNKLVADLWKEPIPSSQRIEITRWTIEDGPDLGQYAHARDALLRAIEAGTATDIGQRILGLMEEWACQCRFEYQLSVPARRGERYTLGDIWPKFVKTIRDVQKRLEFPLGNVERAFDDLKDLPNLRNTLWGHFNEIGQQFPVSSARELGRRTIDIFDTLYCLKCESFALPLPNPDKPVVVACRCGGLRYPQPASATSTASETPRG